jgi:arylsulfatase A-like enzyme
MRSVPNSHGFERFYGYLDQVHAHNSFPEHLWDNENEDYLTYNWFNARKVFSNGLFTARSVEFIEKQDAAKPFFLYLPYTIPHANNERGKVEANGMDVPDLGPYANENWPEVEKAFAASITRMDSDIGKVLAALDARGMAENTLIVFSSDNGPHREGNHQPSFFESCGPLRGIKRDLYEGGIRVPGIARWRGRIRPGQVSAAPWAFWDFLPTACALAGVQAPAGLDGVDIRPTLLDGRPVARGHFYWEFHEDGFAQAVRQGEWKLVRQKPRYETELYNLAEDPGEKRNLAGKHPDLARRLSELFRTARTDNPNFPI